MRSNGNVKLTDIDDYPVGEYFVNTELPSISGKFYLRITETPTKDSLKKSHSALSGHMMLAFKLEDAVTEAGAYTWGQKGSWGIFELDPYVWLEEGDVEWNFHPYCCRYFCKR